MRGVPYGEFDHVTWLTMEKDGPHVANLLLDGILPADAVTEKGIARFRDFLAKTRIEVAPILIGEDEGLTEGQIEIRVTNQFDQPIEVRGTIQGLPLRGLHVDPAKLEISAAPGETAELAVGIRFAESIAFPHLAETLLTARIRTVGDDPPLSCERTIPVVIDRKFPCPHGDAQGDRRRARRCAAARRVDRRASAAGRSQPRPGPDPDDASLQFGLGRDDRFLYLSAHVVDERIIEGGDALELRLDARSIDQRRNEPQLGRGTLRLPADRARRRATRPSSTSRPSAAASDSKAATAAARRTERRLRRRNRRAHRVHHQRAAADWHSIQATLVVHDQDEKDGKKCAVVWRGTESFANRNTNYGQFATAP